MIPRRSRSALALGVAALLLGAPRSAVANLGAADPCRIVPYDGSAENGFGVSPGATIEYCSELPPPPAGCTLGGWYLVDPIIGVTRTAGGSSTMMLETQVRSSPGPGLPPGPSIAGPEPVSFFDVQIFPGVSRRDFLRASAAQGNLDPLAWLHVCAALDALNNSDQYIAADQSPATPVRPCWGSTNGGPFESCQTSVPALRALQFGGLASQFRAAGTDNQVVPPTTSGRFIRARVNTIDSRALEFHVSGQHDAPNPIAIRVRRGPPGAVGSIVTTLAGPTSPFESVVILSPADDALLASDRLDIEVINAANPNGAARGQLTPANFIFGDGAESGGLD
jgi:hypothetical protein